MQYKIISKDEISCELYEYELNEFDLDFDELQDCIIHKRNLDEISRKLINIIDKTNRLIIEDGYDDFLEDKTPLSIAVKTTQDNRLIINAKKMYIGNPFKQNDNYYDDYDEPNYNELNNNGELPPQDFFSNLLKNLLGLPPYIDEDGNPIDENGNIAPNPLLDENQPKSTKKSPMFPNLIDKKDIKKDDFLIEFKSLDNVIDFAKYCEFKNIKNKLLKNDGKFYLIIDAPNDEQEYKNLDYFVSEFAQNKIVGTKRQPLSIKIAFLNEHANVIIARNAIEKLKTI